MGRKARGYLPAIISGLIGFGIMCTLIIVYIRYYSFTEHNVSPRKRIESFLSETYEGEFTLLEQKFYIENGYNIWEYRFVDENGLVFYEFYKHPVERSSDDPGRYFFFDRKMSDRERDFYMAERIAQEYGEELQLEKYYEVGPWLEKYRFDIKENSIEEVADMIAAIYAYAFENAKNPREAQVACSVGYDGKKWSYIGMEETDEIFEYIGSDKEDIAEYVTQFLKEKYAEINEAEN